MILEPKKIKSVAVSIVSPSICHEVMETVTDLLLSRGSDQACVCLLLEEARGPI